MLYETQFYNCTTQFHNNTTQCHYQTFIRKSTGVVMNDLPSLAYLCHARQTFVQPDRPDLPLTRQTFVRSRRPLSGHRAMLQDRPFTDQSPDRPPTDPHTSARSRQASGMSDQCRISGRFLVRCFALFSKLLPFGLSLSVSASAAEENTG